MPNFAIVKNNIVENIVFGDNKEIVEQICGPIAIEYAPTTMVETGYLYDAETNTFSPPPPPPEPVVE